MAIRDKNTTDDNKLEYRPKYQTYRYLMQNRINEVLLVSSTYDSFIIDEDARLSDQIFEEFHNLNLRTLPHIFRASSVSQALELLKERKFDLVITMRRLGEINPLLFADQAKAIQDIPVVSCSTCLQKPLKPAILTILLSGTEILPCLLPSSNCWKTI